VKGIAARRGSVYLWQRGYQQDKGCGAQKVLVMMTADGEK